MCKLHPCHFSLRTRTPPPSPPPADLTYPVCSEGEKGSFCPREHLIIFVLRLHPERGARAPSCWCWPAPKICIHLHFDYSRLCFDAPAGGNRRSVDSFLRILFSIFVVSCVSFLRWSRCSVGCLVESALPFPPPHLVSNFLFHWAVSFSAPSF